MQNIGTFFSLVTLNLNSATAAYICSRQFDKTRDRKIWRILFCRRDLIVIVLKSSIVPRRPHVQVHAKDIIEMKEVTSGSIGQKMSNPSRKKREESTLRSSEGISCHMTGRYSSGNTLHSTYDFFESKYNHNSFINCTNDFI